jgi:hypothetical protein
MVDKNRGIILDGRIELENHCLLTASIPRTAGLNYWLKFKTLGLEVWLK